jgi:peroxiredoxin
MKTGSLRLAASSTRAFLAYKADALPRRLRIAPMKSSMKFAAFALVATATLASPAFAALKEGTQAPDFSAPAYLAGKPFTFKLADALKQGPVVVYFFPAAHTAGCNVEAHLFSEAIDKFKAQHATVIGVTAGNVTELADFSKETEHCGGKFPVAADDGAKIAKEYDAMLLLRPGWSNRTSYVIAPTGKITHVYSDLSPKKHVEETLNAVKAIEK